MPLPAEGIRTVARTRLKKAKFGDPNSVFEAICRFEARTRDATDYSSYSLVSVVQSSVLWHSSVRHQSTNQLCMQFVP